MEDDGTIAIVIVLCGLLFFGIVAVIAYNITYDRKSEVIKCINECGNILQSSDEARVIALPLKEACAERCMVMRDAQQPIIYKAECVYRVENNNWVNPYYPYYSEYIHWDNYTFNITENYTWVPNPGWVYVND
jgi:hypothetical protein